MRKKNIDFQILSLEAVKLALLCLVFSISAFPTTGTKPLTCLYLLLGTRAKRNNQFIYQYENEHCIILARFQVYLSDGYFINDRSVSLLPFKGPDNKELQVENLRSGLFVEDQESNTFSVNFTWERPSFKHSIARAYVVSYEFYGFSRGEISCSPGLVRDKDRSGCSKSGVVS